MFQLRSFSSIFLVLLFSFGAWAENTDHVDQLRLTRSCADCDLAGAVFDGEDLSTAVLTNASLYGTSFNNANLAGADLSTAMLSLAHLQGTDLSGANLTGADLTKVDLSAADLTGAILTDAVTDEGTTCPDASSGPCQF
jgi:uncharacterized protein YjbI with pentapeptide repeats